jgi:ABC-type nickel/cobalt efflux system permease component RcnA
LTDRRSRSLFDLLATNRSFTIHWTEALKGKIGVAFVGWEQALLIMVAVIIIAAICLTSKDHREHFYDQINIMVLVSTLIVLAYTCWAILQQVNEMKKVYDPIEIQSKAANDQLDIMQQESRAWIDLGATEFTNASSATEPLKVTAGYANFGRQPATDVTYYSDFGLPAIDDQSSSR